MSAGTLLWGCAAAKSAKKKTYVKECVLPDDQTGTLSGRWKVQPVPIALFHANEWSAEDRDAVTKSADAWNDLYSASLGIKVLDYGDKANPNSSNTTKPSQTCVSSIVSGKSFVGQVVIYQQGQWPYANHDAIALTTFCPFPDKPIPYITMGIMELNFQDFFSDGKKQPDMISIVTHELGHLIGLDHSCNSNGKNGFPNCSAQLPEDYVSAVMFPVFGFTTSGAGEQRRDLTANDQGRANCLYQDLVKPGG